MGINRVNVVDEVIKHLEGNILSGVWQPGQKIDTELSLSDQLAVSRASVHSAIQQLVAIGVLESHQGKGTFVKSISLIEIKNRLQALTNKVSVRKMVEFRIILEGEICRRIAHKISQSTLDELDRCIEETIRHRDDPHSTVNYDIQFHRTLFLSTHNEIIIQSLNVICDEVERSHLMNFNPDSINQTIDQFQNIVRCLRAGDGDGARKYMLLHLTSAPCDPPFNTDSVEDIESTLFNC